MVRGVCFGILVLLGTALTALADTWPERHDVMAIALQVQSAVPTARQVRLMVQLTNESRQPYRIIYTLPWYMVDVTVKDDRGERIPPVTSPRGGRIWFENHIDLKAGQTQILRAPDHSEWLDLSDWGYRINKPGRYTIEAAPTVQGFQPSGTRITNRFDTKGSPHSQPVVVEIMQ